LVIYVSRSDDAGQRAVLGEPRLRKALETAVTEAGGGRLKFHVHSDFRGRQPPPMKEQIDMFSHARIVVGAHGGGLANVFWVGAGSGLVELPLLPAQRSVYAILSAAFGIDYWVVPQVGGTQFGDFNITERGAEYAAATLRAAITRALSSQAGVEDRGAGVVTHSHDDLHADTGDRNGEVPATEGHASADAEGHEEDDEKDEVENSREDRGNEGDSAVGDSAEGSAEDSAEGSAEGGDMDVQAMEDEEEQPKKKVAEAEVFYPGAVERVAEAEQGMEQGSEDVAGAEAGPGAGRSETAPETADNTPSAPADPPAPPASSATLYLDRLPLSLDARESCERGKELANSAQGSELTDAVSMLTSCLESIASASAQSIEEVMEASEVRPYMDQMAKALLAMTQYRGIHQRWLALLGRQMKDAQLLRRSGLVAEALGLLPLRDKLFTESAIISTQRLQLEMSFASIDTLLPRFEHAILSADEGGKAEEQEAKAAAQAAVDVLLPVLSLPLGIVPADKHTPYTRLLLRALLETDAGLSAAQRNSIAKTAQQSAEMLGDAQLGLMAMDLERRSGQELRAAGDKDEL